jgi:Co/Zn/Cd efflux system component
MFRSWTACVCDSVGMAQSVDPALRYTVKLVALLNLGYFGVEFAVALAIGSVSLFADSIDFLEDATVNGLILVALGWNARRRGPARRAA